MAPLLEWKVDCNTPGMGFDLLWQVRKSERWYPISICLHGRPLLGPEHTWYTCVWIRPEQRPDYLIFPLGSSWLADEFVAEHRPHYQPRIVSAEHTRYTVMVERGAPPASFEHGVSVDWLRVIKPPTLSYYPSWADFYAANAGLEPLHAAVLWRQQPDDHWVYWSAYEYAAASAAGPVTTTSGVVVDAGFALDAFSRGFARAQVLSEVSHASKRRYFGLFYGDPIQGAHACVGLTETNLANMLDSFDHVPAEWDVPKWPLRIHAEGEPGPAQRFSIVYADNPHYREARRVMRVRRPFYIAPSGQLSQPFAGGVGNAAPPFEPASSSKAPTGPAPSKGPAPTKEPVPSQANAWSGFNLPSTSMDLPEGVSLPAPSFPVDPSAAFDPPNTSVTVGEGVDLPGPPTGPFLPLDPSDPFYALDAYVLGLMRRFNVRAAQLAVAYQGRLVHAPAFTWAEVDYPVTTPFIRMRVGSISKALTHMAATRVWEETKNTGSGFKLFATPEQTSWSIAQYIQPGVTPEDELFSHRSVAQTFPTRQVTTRT